MIDNKTTKLGDTLKEYIRPGDSLSIITAYTTLYAYEALKKELSKLDECNILFSQNLEITGNVSKLVGDDAEIPLRNELNQKKIARCFRQWIEKKCAVREIQGDQPPLQNLFHISKKSGGDVGIQGNSNFTSSGLGYSYSPGFAMNTMPTDTGTTDQIYSMFQSVWENTAQITDVKEKILSAIDRIITDTSPEEIYFFTLYYLFKDFVEDVDYEHQLSEKTGFRDSTVWNKLYNFQRDGVMGAIEKLERYKGCIIADSVGLGKTFEALAVIKYYQLRNGRVLVIAPKKLRDNWATYTLNDKRNLLVEDRFNYDILNHTDL
ncbi:MAG: SNF2-related protein, partial [Fibrobacterota bacterium]